MLLKKLINLIFLIIIFIAIILNAFIIFFLITSIFFLGSIRFTINHFVSNNLMLSVIISFLTIIYSFKITIFYLRKKGSKKNEN